MTRLSQIGHVRRSSLVIVCSHSIKLRRQQPAGGNQQNPCLVGADLDLLALRCAALELERVFVLARRQIDLRSIRRRASDPGSDLERVVVDGDDGLFVREVAQQHLPLPGLGQQPTFAAPSGSGCARSTMVLSSRPTALSSAGPSAVAKASSARSAMLPARDEPGSPESPHGLASAVFCLRRARIGSIAEGRTTWAACSAPRHPGRRSSRTHPA
jgi:hypothetical protein